MPGMELKFNCPCGFKKDKIVVGSTKFESFNVFICITCQSLFSLKINTMMNDVIPKMLCKRCDNQLLSITDSGAWGPLEIQTKFANLEPWLVDEYDNLMDCLPEFLDSKFNIDDIRIFCPKCKSYTLEFETMSYWD